MVSGIMIVEDNAFARMMLKEMIESHGYHVAGEANCGRDAIAMYSELLPDVVTMDITMPDLNGIEVARAILEIDPKAQIIMISGLGQPDPIINSLKAGAVDFLAKPFKKDRVIKAIKQIVDKAETTKNNNSV